MRAAMFVGSGKPLEITTVDDPTPGPGEAVIATRRCGICGSDIHLTSGHGQGFSSGTLIGHEYTGQVVAVGRGVERLKIGDSVSAMPVAGCGRCRTCARGNVILCREKRSYVGGCADFTKIAEASAVVLPSRITPADGALVEPLAVGLHGVRRVSYPVGARILVIGAGAAGLATIFWAAKLGVGRIVVTSRSSHREMLALKFGASAFVESGPTAGEEIEEALGGPPDVVFECVGLPGLLDQAIERAAIGGAVVCMGFCTVPDAIVPATGLFKEVSVHFSMGYTLAEFQQAANCFDAGRIEPRVMVERTVTLEELPEAFEEQRAGSAAAKLHVQI